MPAIARAKKTDGISPGSLIMTIATLTERIRGTVEQRWNRRALLGAALGAAAASVTTARAQPPAAPGAVSPEPTPRDWSGGAPLRYPDPDLVALDARFQRYI